MQTGRTITTRSCWKHADNCKNTQDWHGHDRVADKTCVYLSSPAWNLHRDPNMLATQTRFSLDSEPVADLAHPHKVYKELAGSLLGSEPVSTAHALDMVMLECFFILFECLWWSWRDSQFVYLGFVFKSFCGYSIVWIDFVTGEFRSSFYLFTKWSCNRVVTHEVLDDMTACSFSPTYKNTLLPCQLVQLWHRSEATALLNLWFLLHPIKIKWQFITISHIAVTIMSRNSHSDPIIHCHPDCNFVECQISRKSCVK